MKQSATKVRPVRRHANGRPAPAYQALINRFPLRPLRTERDYDEAAVIIDALAVRPEGSLDAGEQDYFDTLTMLVEAYDHEHYADDAAKRDPIAMLTDRCAGSVKFFGASIPPARRRIEPNEAVVAVGAGQDETSRGVLQDPCKQCYATERA